MPLCKYGCGEEVQFIDGKAYSLQNHMKVCDKGNAGKKKAKEPELSDEEEQIRAATLVGLIKWFGDKRARVLLPRLEGNTPEERIRHAIRLEAGES